MGHNAMVARMIVIHVALIARSHASLITSFQPPLRLTISKVAIDHIKMADDHDVKNRKLLEKQRVQNRFAFYEVHIGHFLFYYLQQ